MAQDKAAVRLVLDQVKAAGRTALTAPEAKKVCDAYGIPLPKESMATSADEAASQAGEIGFPVVMKIVSADILHKTEAGGVKIGVASAEAARTAYEEILKNAKRYKADAKIDGVQIQRCCPPAHRKCWSEP
jgi:acyl-CoA synthetase (NDP forming)